MHIPAVSSFMQAPLHFVSISCNLREAAELLSKNKIGLLIVQDPDSKKMVGVLSERDLVQKVLGLGLNLAEVPLSDVMTGNVLTVPPNATPFQALNIMLYQHVRHLPVVDSEGQPIGMLSIRDLLQNMLENAYLI